MFYKINFFNNEIVLLNGVLFKAQHTVFSMGLPVKLCIWNPRLFTTIAMFLKRIHLLYIILINFSEQKECMDFPWLVFY